MGNSQSMAQYQFSNAELEEIKILLEHTGKMSGTIVANSTNALPYVCNRLVATINSILAARNVRG